MQQDKPKKGGKPKETKLSAFSQPSLRFPTGRQVASNVKDPLHRLE